MSFEINPETIEAYHQGRLSRPDKAELEQAMQQDEQVRIEVQAYLKILDGFMAKKETSFHNQMKSWEKEASNQDSDQIALIEAYLDQELHPANAARMEAQMQRDPQLAEEVQQYKKLKNAFQAKQSEAFAERLKAWETDSQKHKRSISKRLYYRVGIAASFVLLMGIGTNWYAQQNYAANHLIEEVYTKPLSPNIMGKKVDQAAWSKQFEQTHQLLQNGQFAEAQNAFAELSQQLSSLNMNNYNQQLYQYDLEFSQALALLGANGKAAAKPALESIAQNPAHDYQEKAQQLLDKLDSFWYQVAN
ncbi:MAG: hypothetical protein MRY78_15095 [Saprospiraceae bacterium]|nr:hypothetical protein [Saprospiraceae bacterium]